MSNLDAKLLRASFQVALKARAAGNHPFGAILADHHGQILLEAENTVVTKGDPTGHAETNLIRMISGQFDLQTLSECTLYASCEPCPMCSGAIYWGSVARVVYGLSQERLYSVAGDGGPSRPFSLPGRDVLARGTRRIEVSGPALEDEAWEVHRGFWR